MLGKVYVGKLTNKMKVQVFLKIKWLRIVCKMRKSHLLKTMPIIVGKEANAYENVCWDNRL